VNCDCLAVAGNAALSGFAFRSKARPFSLDVEKGQNLRHPPRLKITLIVVSTSTGSLLSR
jgi:hypothetical protein